MLRNFLKTAYRNILKHKGYSFINIFGLAIGIASFLLIMLFVQGELGFDRFNKNAERIHRISLKFHVGSNQFEVANGPVPVAAALVADFPEITSATRLYQQGDVNVRFEDKQFLEERFLWADSNIFDVFDIVLLKGEASQVLLRPNSVILTPTTAKKYFGDSEPVGQTLTFEDGTLYTVTGIAREMPVASHFHFDLLAAFSTLEESRNTDWLDVSAHTYVMFQDGYDPAQFEAKLPEFTRKYVGPNVEEMTGSSYDEFLAAGNVFAFFPEPLVDIHLKSKVYNQFESGGSYNTVIIFSAVALIILLVACINFINLATARSAERANEVGVRKAVGSSRKQLVWQFLAESVFLSGVGVAAAVIIACNFIPLFNSLLNTQLTTSFLTDWYFLPIVIGLTLVVGVIAGSYPAFMLSSFNPVTVLKGKYGSNSRGGVFRNVLVIFQFVASIVLFIGTIVIYSQLDFIQKKDLGYDKDSVVVVAGTLKLGDSQQAFKNLVLQNANVVSSSFTDALPYMRLGTEVVQKDGAGSNEFHSLIAINADQDFVEALKLRMVSGRYFDPERITDSTAIILNEAAVSALGLQDPVGKRLTSVGEDNPPFTVIGVVNNFHIQSLHEAIRPVAITPLNRRPGEYLSVRIRPGAQQETLGQIETLWNRFVPEQPVDFAFFDESIDGEYSKEAQASKVVTSFSVLAIVIACLGLFGLASFTAGRRAKEIGIRKVLGATEPEIVFLLAREFIRWVLIANVIAWPIAYYMMNRWLEGFAYRTSFGIMTFVIAGVAALAIAVLTVSYQAIKAARANPVDSIQYE